MGGYAWVTLATNDSYGLGALVLAHTLRQVGTLHELAIIITPGVTNAMRQKLAAIFNVVKEVDILDSRDETNLRLLHRPELGITFTKLHCWQLTQFEKCVFLDADTMVLDNVDELFEREELSAAPDVGWPDCFNSGVFVYKPSDDTFAKLIDFALQKGSFDGGDQGLLNLYFCDWAHKDINKHLPFIYNMCSTACYSYLPAFKQFGANAKIIHFIGNTKPWLQYFDTQTRQVVVPGDMVYLKTILQKWWDIFCFLIHPTLTADMGGLAGAFAQLQLGVARTTEQTMLDDHLRRQCWESGNIDYMGRDSFDSIWSKICQTLSEPPVPAQPAFDSIPAPIEAESFPGNLTDNEQQIANAESDTKKTTPEDILNITTKIESDTTTKLVAPSTTAASDVSQAVCQKPTTAAVTSTLIDSADATIKTATKESTIASLESCPLVPPVTSLELKKTSESVAVVTDPKQSDLKAKGLPETVESSKTTTLESTAPGYITEEPRKFDEKTVGALESKTTAHTGTEASIHKSQDYSAQSLKSEEPVTQPSVASKNKSVTDIQLSTVQTPLGTVDIPKETVPTLPKEVDPTLSKEMIPTLSKQAISTLSKESVSTSAKELTSTLSTETTPTSKDSLVTVETVPTLVKETVSPTQETVPTLTKEVIPTPKESPPAVSKETVPTSTKTTVSLPKETVSTTQETVPTLTKEVIQTPKESPPAVTKETVPTSTKKTVSTPQETVSTTQETVPTLAKEVIPTPKESPPAVSKGTVPTSTKKPVSTPKETVSTLPTETVSPIAKVKAAASDEKPTSGTSVTQPLKPETTKTATAQPDGAPVAPPRKGTGSGGEKKKGGKGKK